VGSEMCIRDSRNSQFQPVQAYSLDTDPEQACQFSVGYERVIFYDLYKAAEAICLLEPGLHTSSTLSAKHNMRRIGIMTKS